MYRRRRPSRDKIVFGFDSFLDVVANVIGIILRLMLVAWVGARSYTAALKFVEETPHVEAPVLPVPKSSDDPVHAEIARVRDDLEEARRRLHEKLGLAEKSGRAAQTVERDLALLMAQNKELDRQVQQLETELAVRGKSVQLVALSAEELRRRGQLLLAQIKSLEKTPLEKKSLHYHAPVSRLVEGDELFFECRNGRVTFIDLPAFLHEVQAGARDVADQLRTQAKVTRTTRAVGAFRLRYTFERDVSLLDAPDRGFHYGLSEWVLEPITPQRGETLNAALTPGSDFRRVADAIDPNQTVVTVWVYSDSFDIFRRLRDYLYDKEVQVAGRPLPMDASIAASRSGSRSRGQ